MSLIFYDRVKQNIFASGTGALNFSTPITNYVTFESAILGTNTFPYVIVNATQFEVGIGNYASIAQSGTANGMLNRIMVLTNSNGNNGFINFNNTPATAAITNAADLSVLTSTPPVANTVKLIKWINNEYELIDPVYNAPLLGTSITDSVMFYNPNSTNFTADPNFKFFPVNVPEVFVNGVVSATAKSFRIPHPIKENKYLMHGSLEGPEYGIYLRGVDTVHYKTEIVFPEYFQKLTDTGYTVYISSDSFIPIKVLKCVDKIVVKQIIPSVFSTKIDYLIIASRRDIQFNLEE